jgi:hypothetical protein
MIYISADLFGLVSLFSTHSIYHGSPAAFVARLRFVKIGLSFKLENTRNKERVVSHLDVLGDTSDDKYRSIL